MFVSFFLRSPLEDGGELGIIAEGDMHNSAKADGRERLTAFKAVEAKLRRLGGLAFAANSKDRIADDKLIDSIPASFPSEPLVCASFLCRTSRVRGPDTLWRVPWTRLLDAHFLLYHCFEGLD